MKPISPPTRVLVYAEFPCVGCGVVCERMTAAAITPDGRIGDAEPYPHPVLCRACFNAANAARVEAGLKREHRKSHTRTDAKGAKDGPPLSFAKE